MLDFKLSPFVTKRVKKKRFQFRSKYAKLIEQAMASTVMPMATVVSLEFGLYINQQINTS